MYIPRPAKLLFLIDDGWDQLLAKHGDAMAHSPEGYPPTNYNPHNNLCTGSYNAAQNSGDSGGPIMADEQGQKVVVGLVSRSLVSPAAQTTKVSYFADWIERTLNSDTKN
jgi:secreted trypsin-like serine protease